MGEMILEMPRMDPRHVDQKIWVKGKREKIRPQDRNDGSKIEMNRRHNDGRKGHQKGKKVL